MDKIRDKEIKTSLGTDCYPIDSTLQHWPGVTGMVCDPIIIFFKQHHTVMVTVCHFAKM